MSFGPACCCGLPARNVPDRLPILPGRNAAGHALRRQARPSSEGREPAAVAVGQNRFDRTVVGYVFFTARVSLRPGSSSDLRASRCLSA